MCYIIEENVRCPFETDENYSSYRGDLVVHSSGLYTWETEDNGHRIVFDNTDGKAELKGYITLELATELAKRRGEAITFDDMHGDETTGYSGSQHGMAYPCGCIRFDTILSDGSLGWGEWWEECSLHFFARD